MEVRKAPGEAEGVMITCLVTKIFIYPFTGCPLLAAAAMYVHVLKGTYRL